MTYPGDRRSNAQIRADRQARLYEQEMRPPAPPEPPPPANVVPLGPARRRRRRTA